MNNLIRQWNGRVIRQREDGYLSATDMCQACGKLFADWNRLKATEALLEALSSDMGIPISELIEVKKGNSSDFEQGAWVHAEVAIDLAQWLNVQLRIQVNRWTIELMTKGKVELIPQQPDRSQLPQFSPAQEVAMVADAFIKLGIDPTNPRYSQGIRDWTLNKLGVVALPASIDEQWMGVAERAEELGFGRIGADLSKRIKLGSWVSRYTLTRRREKRLCNGQDREIWCYLVCDELDRAISDFFA